MLSEQDKQTLIAAATIIRIEARWFHDAYKRTLDSRAAGEHIKGHRAYEKFEQLERIARELDVIAFGPL
jgi:hypothetical protein